MKVEHKLVLSIFDQMLGITNGIIETARWGDDGYLTSMEDQRDEMKKIILDFRSQHLTKEETQTVAGKYQFIEEGERLIRNNQHLENGKINSNEITHWVKYLCYNYLKKALRDSPVQPDMNELDLTNHIDCLCIDWPKFKIYEMSFSQTMFQVVQIVAAEVIEYRNQNQQLTLL